MQGKKWKSFMAKLYGFGAAVVIVGAMFKIQHWPGAGPMLVVGLSVEAVIFFFSAFEKPHEDPDWSLVYPELAGIPGEGGHGHGGGGNGQKGLSPSQELDKLLEDAKIGPELIESLGNNLRSLGDNVAKMSDITDASVATELYVGNVKKAAETVGSLSEAYIKASSSLGAMVVDGEGVDFGSEMKKMGENVTQLNSQYKLQLAGTKQFLESSDSLYSGMSQLMSALNESVDDAKKYKVEVAQLAQNISSLNTVYGNMLSAMNRPQG
ncbi:MAG: gliding motility protein GldL, partial [Flavobacteriales bacterium]|nr:gliding motility protein GldL [Flavobacteriales bacterium]